MANKEHGLARPQREEAMREEQKLSEGVGALTCPVKGRERPSWERDRGGINFWSVQTATPYPLWSR